jgi:hypothetical protein
MPGTRKATGTGISALILALLSVFKKPLLKKILHMCAGSFILFKHKNNFRFLPHLFCITHNYYFGPNYIRTSGVMNAANSGSDPCINRYSGFGNAFAMYGTGQVIYVQAGYLLRHGLLRQSGTLQPTADIMVADYDALNNYMVVWNAGLNWLIRSHHAKISFNCQNRPVYMENPMNKRGSQVAGGRKNMLVLMMQASF